MYVLTHGQQIRLNINMANQDVKSKLKYWTEGTTGTLIKANNLTLIGGQSYWYNGSTEGYLAGSEVIPQPRSFAVLIGF